MNEKSGLAFPEAGEFYQFLPQIFRNQDGGILYAFCELLRQSHSTAKEYSRVAWAARDPDQIGKFINDHFGESATELSEFLDQVEEGSASLDSPPPSLRDSVNVLRQFRDLLSYASQSIGSGVPLEALGDSVSRRVIKMAKVRHKTRGTKWLANNIGRILGMGDVKAIEWWARSGVTDIDDLSEVPDLYPRVAESIQFPTGAPSWDASSFDDGVAGLSIYDPLSIDPESPLWYQTQVNNTSPVVQISGVGRNAPLRPGVYHLAFDPAGSRAYVDIPYLDGNGSVRASSFQTGVNRSLSVSVGIWDGTKFRLKISGPRSSFKFKSSTYSLMFYLDFIAGASLLDLDDDGNVIMNSVTRALNILLAEEFQPATRHLRGTTSGFGMRDPVLYAPVIADQTMFVADSSGSWYRVVAIGGGMTILVAATNDEISTAGGDGTFSRWGAYRQWDEARQQMICYGARTGADGPILMISDINGYETDGYSDLIRANGYYVWCYDGEVITSLLPPPSDTALLGRADWETPDGTESDLISTAFGDRPRDTLSKLHNRHLDDCGFYVANRWNETAERWIGWLGTDNGSDIRFREAATIDGNGLPEADRDQRTERRSRHNDLTANAIIPIRARLNGLGLWVTEDLEPGADEGAVLPDGNIVDGEDDSYADEDGEDFDSPGSGFGPFHGIVEPGFPNLSGLFRLREASSRVAVISEDQVLNLSGSTFGELPDRLLIKNGGGWQVVRVDPNTGDSLALDILDPFEVSGTVTALQLIGTVASPGGGVSITLRFPVLMTANVVVISESPDGTLSLTHEATPTGREWSYENPNAGPRIMVFVGTTSPVEFEYYLTSETVPTLSGVPRWKAAKDAIASSQVFLTPVCWLSAITTGDFIWWTVYGVFGDAIGIDLPNGPELAILDIIRPSVVVHPSTISVDTDYPYPIIPATPIDSGITRIKTGPITLEDIMDYDGDPMDYDGDPWVYDDGAPGTAPTAVIGTMVVEAYAHPSSATDVTLAGVSGYDDLAVGDFLMIDCGGVNLIPAVVTIIDGHLITVTFSSGFSADAFNLNNLRGSTTEADVELMWRRSSAVIRHIRID